MATIRRRSVSSGGGSGSGSGSAGEGDEYSGERQELDMQGLPFYSYYRGDAHTKLIEELRREKDILVRKLSKTNPEEARKIRHELVHAGILDHDPEDGDDGGNHAMMLLQLTAFSSVSSPSSSPLSSSPIGGMAQSSTPPLYPDAYAPLPVSHHVPSPLSLHAPPSSSSQATFGTLSSSATAFINASAASGPVPAGQKAESAFITFNPVVTTVTSPHAVSTSTIIPSMSSATCSSDLLASKKKRQRTNPEQLQILEQIFETEKMPSQQVRQQLAEQLGMSTRRIQIWFQNKRAKVKRHPGGTPVLSSSGSILNKSLDEGSTDDEDDEEGLSSQGASPSPARSSSAPQVHIHSAAITAISLAGRGGAGAQSGPMFVPHAAISI